MQCVAHLSMAQGERQSTGNVKVWNRQGMGKVPARAFALLLDFVRARGAEVQVGTAEFCGSFLDASSVAQWSVRHRMQRRRA